MDKLEVLEKIAFLNYGKPYKWGGNDPIASFDCSGFVIECLQSIGLLPHKFDTTAQGLYDRFVNNVDVCEDFTRSYFGDVVFYFNSNSKVTHVELCLGDGLCIGASGGGSRTNTVGDAIKQNAYIKVRPINYRKNSRVLQVSDLIK